MVIRCYPIFRSLYMMEKELHDYFVRDRLLSALIFDVNIAYDIVVLLRIRAYLNIYYYVQY